MAAHSSGYTLLELSDLTGVKYWTLREWRKQGVLQPPKGGLRGKFSYFTDEHVARIEAVKKMRDNNRTLDDIRDYFDPLEDDE